ncbi:unnamed protein product, partial [Ectocarpus fasciculatus]
EGGRARNVPGAAFRKARDMARNAFGSPAPSNSSSFNPFTPAGSNVDSSSGKPPPYMTPSRTGNGDERPPPYRTPGRDGSTHADGKEKRTTTGVGKLLPKKTWRNMKRSDSSTPGARRRSPVQDTSTYQVGDGLVRGKVNREILETVFGEALTTSIAVDNSQRAVKNLLRSDSDSDIGDAKEGQDKEDEDLTGTDQTARKLQVTASVV